jgi:ligand-binding sensor domain-containing protein/two-component sensor histidine kinase
MSSGLKGILFILLMNWLPNSSATGQSASYVFRNINTSDGLASDGVTSIIQDNSGFMWIGTNNGLQKFDGYSFTTYHHDPYDPQSISSDNITFLLKDRENTIWVSTSFLGFNRFDAATSRNMRIFDPDDSSFRDLDNSVSACLDAQGNAWLLSINAVAKFDFSQRRLVFYDHLFPKDIAMGMTKTILCDPRTGNLWMNSLLDGICMLDPKRSLLFNRSFNPQKLPIFDLVNDPGTLFLDTEGNLWVNSYTGKLYRYNLETGQIKQYLFHEPDDPLGKTRNILIDCIMQDRHGTIWMGARKQGLLAYSPQTDSFRTIAKGAHEPGGLDYEEYLLSLCEDREGNIWIGSDKGIFIFNPYWQQFSSVRLPALPNGALNTTSVLALLETRDGEIWAATYGQGIHVFDNQLHYSRTYTYQSKVMGQIGEPANRIWSLLSYPDGKIIIGSQHGWVSTYDPVRRKLISSQPEGLDKSTIVNMVLDSAHNIWLAMYSGLAKWDHEKKIFTQCPKLLAYHRNHIKEVFDLLVDNDQNLWLATQTNGLQKFDVSTQHFTKMYVPEKDHPDGISNSSVQCITKITDSIYALGTSSGGINLFNRKTDQFSYVTAKEGLPSNNVSALYFQSPRNLWVATAQGLCKVDIASRKVYHYGLEDGIVNDNFGDCTRFYKTKDGRLLIGYAGGILSFNPDSIGNKESLESVTITGFKIFDRPLLMDSVLAKSDTLSLSFDQNFIAINYATLSYLQPQRINYYYQLEGVDRNWVNAGAQRVATYTNLSPGGYTFRVKSENRDGIASQRMTTLFIIIHPPFWQTWWFIFLMFAAVVIFLYGLYRYRINQLLQMQAMRNKISKDLHDDLGATLSSISILSEVAKNSMRPEAGSQTYSLLSKISTNAREMVEMMSDIVWAINPKNENLDRMIQRLSDFSLVMCSSKGINMQITADESARRLILPMAAVRNIYLIVKEAMNNAIKHADCKNLAVSFTSIVGGLAVAVWDDGEGFDPSLVRNGNGLLNMNSRVKEMKGRMEIHSGKRNTTIDLRFPIT